MKSKRVLVRFCILRRDPDSHSDQGVFQAAFKLRDEGVLESFEEEWLERELKWLRMHLPSPDCLRDDGNHRAISWFKQDAKTPIEKIRSIVALLESKGVAVKMITTANPGSVLYEDKYQVVAKARRKRAAKKGALDLKNR
jgi:hypothetical protein